MAAPSDQSTALTEYGISAGSMTWPLTERNRPLSESVRGNVEAKLEKAAARLARILGLEGVEHA